MRIELKSPGRRLAVATTGLAGRWCSGGSWKGFQSKGLGWAGLGWPTHPSRGWRRGLRHDLVGVRKARPPPPVPKPGEIWDGKKKKKKSGERVFGGGDRPGRCRLRVNPGCGGRHTVLEVGKGWCWARLWGGFGGWWARAGRKRVWGELGPSSAGGKVAWKRTQRTRVEHIGYNAFTKPTTALCHCQICHARKHTVK